MRNWYLLTHNALLFRSVACKVSKLGVEVYAASLTQIRRRKDCNSSRTLVKQLFPGYLFVRFDPEDIHTTTISRVSGVQGFVRRGTEICCISDEVIEALQSALLINATPAANEFQCGNVPSDVVAELRFIAEIPSLEKRQAALLALLKREKLEQHSSSRIYSTIEN